MIKKGYKKSDKKLLLTGTSFATLHQPVVCIGRVLEDMMMIVMEAEMKIGMVMGKKENGAIGMMTDMVDMVMEIVIAEILKNAMVIMMICVEEVKPLMITSMAREVEALIEIGTVLMKMMVSIHLGFSCCRGSGAKPDDQSQDGRRLERKFSEQNLGGPPSYEEAVGDAHSPVRNERDGETSAASASKTSSPTANENLNQATTTPSTSVASAPAPAPAPAPANKEVDGFDEFDPRGSFSAGPTTSNGAEMDLLGSLSESFSSNSLAIIPVTSATTTSEADAAPSFGSGPTFLATPSVSTVSNQPFEDPFGDGPFKAIPSSNGVSAQPQNVGAVSSFLPGTNQSFETPQPVAQKVDTVNNINFGETLSGVTYTSSDVSIVQAPSTNPQFSPQDLSVYDQNTDILADILPPSGPSSASQSSFPAPTGQPVSYGFHAPTGQPASQPGFPAPTGQPASQMGFSAQNAQPLSLAGFPAQSGQAVSQSGFPPQTGHPASMAGFTPLTGQPPPQAGFPAQNGQPSSLTGFPSQVGPASQTGFPTLNGQPTQPSASSYGSFHPQSGSTAPVAPHMAYQTPAGPAMQQNPANIFPQSGFASTAGSQALQTPTRPVSQNNSEFLGNLLPQAQPTTSMATQPAPSASAGALAIVPQPEKNKFETKSTVWADTLSRGLVDLNISGAKINPLSDIGIDFDAINRKEKRMEKPSAAPVTSTINMGKAMGSGSGIGRAGAGALRAPPNAMMGSGIGMGMGGGPGAGMGMGPGAGMGMGGGPGAGMGMGMGGGPGAGMAMGGGPGLGMGMGGGPGLGMGMGGYGGVNQPMGMGIGMNMPVNNGMGMNMGMGQGVRMQQPTGFPPGSTMAGGYNPMMGTGGYAQQPYGGGYR
ncbi:clathrin interactor EPSIN 3-like isoform X2 [Cornus florida]|uniref:clathrin interactor EPSIN 3-like isoform X2 n=1 Tax=Cornus florida TaxID=4283 RepID=UPI0028A285F2|nr:clathrin interactor EPSIN 3-like isoform X2 [Cornus florida]